VEFRILVTRACVDEHPLSRLTGNWPGRPPNHPQEGKGSLETPKTDPAIDSLRRSAVGSFLL
jgi:hypothetical protein